MRAWTALLANDRLRLGLLLIVLVALAAFAVGGGAGFLGEGDGQVAARSCPAGEVPSTASVDRAGLAGLREDVRRAVFFAKGLRPYEQGPIGSDMAWSDAEPGNHATLPAGPVQPGGYEMRWWMPSGDDVAVDVLAFADRRRARDFFVHASRADCRSRSRARSASMPPGGRNLAWLNPDGFMQEDAFLLRGRRVYRVVVVRPGSAHGASPAAIAEAFRLVDALACALPGAGCSLGVGSASA
jgi:hypothetical protein